MDLRLNTIIVIIPGEAITYSWQQSRYLMVQLPPRQSNLATLMKQRLDSSHKTRRSESFKAAVRSFIADDDKAAPPMVAHAIVPRYYDDDDIAQQTATLRHQTTSRDEEIDKLKRAEQIFPIVTSYTYGALM